jgi:hypothetical protein
MLRTGSGARIIAAIRETPRAVTFVSAPWSVRDWRARQAYRAAVAQLDVLCPEIEIRFFILDASGDGASQDWLASIGLSRLTTTGAGGIIWSEQDRVVASETSVNALGTRAVVARTLSIWQRDSDSSHASCVWDREIDGLYAFAAQDSETARGTESHGRIGLARSIWAFFDDLFRSLWSAIQLLKQGGSGGGPQWPTLA